MGATPMFSQNISLPIVFLYCRQGVLIDFVSFFATTDDVCKVGDRTYYPGDSYPDAEFCNMCTCGANGLAACTLMACTDTGGK